MSQKIAHQKVRRLCRLAFAFTPQVAWLPAVIVSGAASGFLCAQTESPQASPAPAATSQPATPVAAQNPPAGLTTELVLRWLNSAADSAAKQDRQGASIAYAEALRGRYKLPPGNSQIESRIQEVATVLKQSGIQRYEIENALQKLGPIERSIAASAPLAPVVSPESAWQSPNLPALPSLSANASSSGVTPATGSISSSNATPAFVRSGVFNPTSDTSHVQPAAAQSELKPTPTASATGTLSGDELYRKGMEALSQGDREKALEFFKKAWHYQGELDPALRTQLKDKLMGLQSISPSNPSAQEQAASPADNLNQEAQAIRSRLMSEITGEIARAEAERDKSPQVVAERLQSLRVRVADADLDGAARKQMLSIVDRAVTAHQLYMTENRAAIEQNMRNRQITEQVTLETEERFKIDQEIASLVEQYNDLMDASRFAEAEVVAKQVGQLDPRSTISTLLRSNARLAKRIAENERLKNEKEDLFSDAMFNVEDASKPFDDRRPMLFPATKEWEALSRNRARLARDDRRGMSPAAAMIWDKLKQPVLVDFQNKPLSEIVKTLSEMTGILMHIDPAGIAAEGITSDKEFTLSLHSQISLRSVLNLLLNPHNLDFDVRDEVLLITSANSSSRANIPVTYSVKDLVLPIPNFITDYNSGMGGAIRSAYETMGRGLVVQSGGLPGGAPSTAQYVAASMNPNSNALGQLNPAGNNAFPGGVMPWPVGGNIGGPIAGFNPGIGFGGSSSFPNNPTAVGSGAAMADFDSLTTLIQQTIDPDSWQQNGGSSTLNPYPSNLSLVVSAPQTTHEKITDLLESLRRLQDLQVTIEVRFITLTDNFFERMGVDFDIKLDDNVTALPPEDQGNSVAVGLGTNFNNLPFTPTADLDLTFRQGGFTPAIPAFGGFDAATAGTFGFAILSDLEMFFFMEAAQGDQRTNVLQAPRVTMFDGQFASINDTVSRPFVTGLTPIVADFAVAQQPVIVVLNEGTILNVQAVVSQDKRFVRLTLNPTFTRIDRVDTFTFEGTETTRTGTNVLDPTGAVTGSRNNEERIKTGTTVQQPSQAQTSVQTTVSVPDGGTILLGGIKRMREGRIERGIPILSKIPYVNRLFRNQAIGRETSTLMMTVTPRIIIQEEAEEFLAGNAP